MFKELEQNKPNKCKSRKKICSEKKISKNQLIEESEDNDKLICGIEEKSLAENSSEPENEMETGSISGNFKAACYCPA